VELTGSSRTANMLVQEEKRERRDTLEPETWRHIGVKLGILGRTHLVGRQVRPLFLVLDMGFNRVKRFNPVFVLPVPERDLERVDAPEDSAIAYRPGRRTGTGSANITQSTRTLSQRIPIAGFRAVSLWKMITTTGYAPKVENLPFQTLDDIRRTATRPVVVFPECTTSNGRGLLRFADVFREAVPVKGYNLFVVSVRYARLINSLASLSEPCV
jgi:hypothetical protein